MNTSKTLDGSNKQSSITVAVRIRPFNQWEKLHLIPEERTIYANNDNATIDDIDSPTLPAQRNVSSSSSYSSSSFASSFSDKLTNILPRPNGIWSLVNCVDDKMLIFNPNNRYNNSSSASINNNNVTTKHKRNQHSWRHRSTNNSNSSNRYNNSSGNNNNNNNSSNNHEIKFIFDKLFDMNTEQETIYNNLMVPLLDSVMDGYNGTIFAYGATGCGKTYTINGTIDNPGIIYRTMDDIFRRIDKLQNDKDFQISLSFLEIYNENIRDLLDPSTPSHKLVIREDSNQRIFVSNLSYHYPRNVEEVLRLVDRGNKNRTTCPTGANLVSSRSHSILQIQITQNDKLIDLTNRQCFGTLSIIDLAGSERAATTKNRGQRLFEGAKINQSLLALGNCINALCSDNKRQHVPYRDSKLTRLLKFSLGGNCKTVMIVCISPSSQHYEETLNTLKYANRAKQIKTKTIKNQQNLNRHISSYLKIINEQKRVIKDLQNRENMIEMKIYKQSNEIYDMIQVMKNDIIFDINNNNSNNLNIINSLTLVKRRILQLLKLRINDNNDNLIDDVIKNLEQQFDYNTKQINERIKFVSGQYLIKLKQYIQNNNNDQREELLNYFNKIYDGEINEIMNNYNKDILIEATNIMERLIRDISTGKENDILSLLSTNIFDNNNNNNKNNTDSYYQQNKDIIMKELEERFDRFTLQYLNNNNNNNNMQVTSNDNVYHNDNILIPSHTEDISLQDITMIRDDMF